MLTEAVHSVQWERIKSLSKLELTWAGFAAAIKRIAGQVAITNTIPSLKICRSFSPAVIMRFAASEELNKQKQKHKQTNKQTTTTKAAKQKQTNKQASKQQQKNKQNKTKKKKKICPMLSLISNLYSFRLLDTIF